MFLDKADQAASFAKFYRTLTAERRKSCFLFCRQGRRAGHYAHENTTSIDIKQQTARRGISRNIDREIKEKERAKPNF